MRRPRQDLSRAICPECGAAEEAPQSKFCSNCGHSFDSKRCFECGVENQARVGFCSSCGASMQDVGGGNGFNQQDRAGDAENKPLVWGSGQGGGGDSRQNNWGNASQGGDSRQNNWTNNNSANQQDSWANNSARDNQNNWANNSARDNQNNWTSDNAGGNNNDNQNNWGDENSRGNQNDEQPTVPLTKKELKQQKKQQKLEKREARLKRAKRRERTIKILMCVAAGGLVVCIVLLILELYVW